MATAVCAVCSKPLRSGYRVRGSTPRCPRHALLHPALLRRSLLTALVVGTILTAINQGDRILAGDVTWEVLLKIGLTYCVPFCVASYGALGASRVSIGRSTAPFQLDRVASQCDDDSEEHARRAQERISGDQR